MTYSLVSVERWIPKWGTLKNLGGIDQLRGSYVVALAAPPLVRVAQFIGEQTGKSSSVGWRLPVAYFAAVFLAAGKLIYDSQSPETIRLFRSASFLHEHLRSVMQGETIMQGGAVGDLTANAAEFGSLDHALWALRKAQAKKRAEAEQTIAAAETDATEAKASAAEAALKVKETSDALKAAEDAESEPRRVYSVTHAAAYPKNLDVGVPAGAVAAFQKAQAPFATAQALVEAAERDAVAATRHAENASNLAETATRDARATRELKYSLPVFTDTVDDTTRTWKRVDEIKRRWRLWCTGMFLLGGGLSLGLIVSTMWFMVNALWLVFQNQM